MENNNKLKWVTAAQILEDFKILLTFNDNRRSIFDCLPLIEQYKIFEPLRNKDVFKNFSLDGWTINWLDGTIDIAPEHLYEKSIALTE